jgi:hypothetical protein
MAVISLTGAVFTVTIGATPYSAQVTEGTLTATPTIARTKTLGDVAYPITDLVHTAKIAYLYDEEAGLHGALNTAGIAGTALTVTVASTGADFTGSMYVESLEMTFTADGVAMGAAELIGTLVLAAVI